MKKIVKIIAFRGNSGKSGGDGGRDGVLNSNHQGTGRGKTAGDLEKQVPWFPRGIPIRVCVQGDCREETRRAY